MDNLEDPSNRINAEASTSSNGPPSSKKHKLSNGEYQDEFESMKQKLDKRRETICGQANTITELNEELQNVKDELEKMKKVEAESQSKIAEFEAEKKAAEAELVKLKSDMDDQLAGLTQKQQKQSDQTKLLQAENDRLKESVEEYNEKTKEMERAYLQKMEEIKKFFINEHNKRMANMKAEMQGKIDNERKEHAVEIEKKESDARAKIIDRDNQIQDLQNELAKRTAKPTLRIVDLDELCDDSGICYDRLLGQNNITVIKVGNLKYNGNVMNFRSDSNNQAVRLNISDFLRNIFRFQMNGECILRDLHGFSCIKKLMPIVHSWNLRKLDLNRITIEYEDFMKFVSSRKITTYIGSAVKRENGEFLKIDEILKELPNIEIFELTCNGISITECKNLVQLPTFSKLRQFKLQFSKSPVELSQCVGFIAKHQNAEFKFVLLSPKGRQSFPKKVQDLLRIIPLNCTAYRALFKKLGYY